jgi:hypothetical protein
MDRIYLEIFIIFIEIWIQAVWYIVVTHIKRPFRLVCCFQIRALRHEFTELLYIKIL